MIMVHAVEFKQWLLASTMAIAPRFLARVAFSRRDIARIDADNAKREAARAAS